MKPLAIDLCAGLGGWTDGLLAEGWDVIGFDIERHRYGSHQYPAQLVLQDILTLDGRQFHGHASLIVASPPCQEFSYMAMPWTRAKQIALALHARKLCDYGPPFPDGYTGSRTVAELTALFDACVRIGREAGCPIVIENVRGAQPWVGRSRWNYGSFHLWGDVPALMPITLKRPVLKDGIAHRTNGATNFHGHDDEKVSSKEGRRTDPGNGARFTSDEDRATKNSGGSWFNVAHNTESGNGQNPDGRLDGVKQPGIGGERTNGKGDAWFQNGAAAHGSKSSARKAASARIARIPETLARHIARVYFPC